MSNDQNFGPSKNTPKFGSSEFLQDPSKNSSKSIAESAQKSDLVKQLEESMNVNKKTQKKSGKSCGSVVGGLFGIYVVFSIIGGLAGYGNYAAWENDFDQDLVLIEKHKIQLEVELEKRFEEGVVTDEPLPFLDQTFLTEEAEIINFLVTSTYQLDADAINAANQLEERTFYDLEDYKVLNQLETVEELIVGSQKTFETEKKYVDDLAELYRTVRPQIVPLDDDVEQVLREKMDQRLNEERKWLSALKLKIDKEIEFLEFLKDNFGLYQFDSEGNPTWQDDQALNSYYELVDQVILSQEKFAEADLAFELYVLE